VNVTQEARDYVPRHPLGVKRPRPRLCAVCHTDATHEEVEIHRLVFVTRDMGTLYRLHPKHIYYCGEHTGMVV
jgi:hypothetical protein